MNLDRYIETIGPDFGQDAAFINDCIAGLHLPADADILDIGTGYGAMAILLALNGYQVLTGQPESGDTDHHHGHENDDPLGWRENARRLGVEERIAFRHFDVQDLPFSDESYDALFLYDTLQHVGDRETALRECLRVMRPNGVTCVIEWTHETIAADEARYGFRIDYIDPAQIVDDEAISVERLKGRLVNFFVLRKAQERA